MKGTSIVGIIIVCLVAGFFIINTLVESKKSTSKQSVETPLVIETKVPLTDNESPTKTPSTSKKTTMESYTTDTGMKITISTQGNGVEVKNGDTVNVNYTGRFADGTAFDSNTDPKFGHVQPFSFTVGAGQVIKGWDEGVAGMKVGEKRTLVIPYTLGYGENGYGSIPPKAELTFEVELLGIQ